MTQVTIRIMPPVRAPRRAPVTGMQRAFAAAIAACGMLGEAFSEARAMQRAAYRHYPFLDW